LGAHRGTAGIFVHASALIDRLSAMGVPPAKLHLLPIGVDTSFWSPRGVQWDGSDYISSAGVELRDYPTLISALRDLPDVHARVAASSPYSRHGNTLDGQSLPANLERVDCDTVGLRDVYECSLFVVVPVVESEIGAGLTTIAEAMSMGKAVITARAEGQADTLADPRAHLRSSPARATSGGVVSASGLAVDDPDLAGPTGLYVPPGDPAQLRDAIRFLIDNPLLAESMGRRGRRVAERVLAVERFGEVTAGVIRQGLDRGLQRQRRTALGALSATGKAGGDGR
jgi:glycosyltransferase involved in cell wall biosynthesis